MWGLWKASRASGYPRPPLGGRTRTPLETIHSPQNHEETEDFHEKTKQRRTDPVQRP